MDSSAGRFVHALVMALFMSCGFETARGEDITFKVAALPDTGLGGWIYVQEAGKAADPRYFIPETGILAVRHACVSGTRFQARVSAEYLPLDGWKACSAGEIKFLFREKAYAAAIRAARSGSALEGVAASGEVKARQDKLTAALKNNDDEEILKSSSQIYNLLIQGNNFTAAEPYRILNFDKAKTRIDGGELTRDVAAQRYVLSPQDVQSIMKIQKMYNLDQTGQLDWPTMRSISKHSPGLM